MRLTSTYIIESLQIKTMSTNKRIQR